MSSYPPPPPYGRDAQRAQRQALKAQARVQRDYARAQRRSLRRRSLVGPLLLVAIGVLFLLTGLGRISWSAAFTWYARWWPAVLILAGLLLLAEWAIDTAITRQRPEGHAPVRVLGGGVVFLLILLALVGLSARGMEHALDWHDRTFGPGDTRFDHLFGEQHDADSALTSAIDRDAALVVHNPHGDVTVTGSSSDGQVHVSVHTRTYAWQDADAEGKARRLQPVFTAQGKDLALNVASVEGGQADLTIELPRTCALTLDADHGDVAIHEMAAPLSVSANHGDVDISGINALVNVHVNNDDADLTLHSITGPVSIDGRGGDTTVSDVEGDVSLQGDFFGATHLQHIHGAVRFESSRTVFSAARIDDDFSISSDDLDASQLAGPVVLRTRDKNVTLDRVTGPVDITNRNGSISLTHTLPIGPIAIQNTHGSVDLGLPQNASFQLNARTRDGSIENDFGLQESTSGEVHDLTGKVGAPGGAAVSITTSDGDVTLRRSSVAPLPPTPPAPPAPPAAPAPPTPPHAPRRPAAPPSTTF